MYDLHIGNRVGNKKIKKEILVYSLYFSINTCISI